MNFTEILFLLSKNKNIGMQVFAQHCKLGPHDIVACDVDLAKIEPLTFSETFCVTISTTLYHQ